jgi:salicylate hydroxylase
MNARIDEPVLVIGAGMGGLALTLALHQFGIPVATYEQAPELAEVGAGIMLKPNARRVLRAIEVDSNVAALSLQPAANRLRHWQTGETLTKEAFDAAFEAHYGSALLTIHRGDLQRALYHAVMQRDPGLIQLDHHLTGIQQVGGSVEATFSSGEVVRGSALVGCDGVRSTVREWLFPGAPAQFTGNVAWRGLVPVDRLGPEARTPDTATFVGPGRHFVCYAVQGGAAVNFVAIAETNQWEEEGWMVPAQREDALRAFEDWYPYVRELIAATPPERLFKWGLFDHEPLPRWTSGRVALLGDAAHAILPFLGQGAALSMEDALVLARALRVAESVEAALASYERVRTDRAAWVQRRTHARATLFHGETNAGGLRDEHAESNEVLFGYDAANVPLNA